MTVYHGTIRYEIFTCISRSQSPGLEHGLQVESVVLMKIKNIPSGKQFPVGDFRGAM